MGRGERLNLVGKRFGRLSVLRKDETKDRVHWICLCDCGNQTSVRTERLTCEVTKSCGCYHREVTKKVATKHGHNRVGQKTPTYTSWYQMIQRCTNPKHKAYARYGGRGITICDRWRNDFTAFLVDMGERPDGTELDRIDNDAGYSPENCQWISHQENMKKMDGRKLYTLGSTSLTLKGWAKQLGVREGMLHLRLNRGWSIEKTLTTGLRVRQDGHYVIHPLENIPEVNR